MANFFRRFFAKRQTTVQIERDGGFVDFTLPITHFDKTDAGTLVVTAQASTDEGTIGFSVVIEAEWKQKEASPGLTLFWGKASVLSTGADSNRFLAFLAKEYRLDAKPVMNGATPVTIVGLGSDPREVSTTPAKMKIFFEAGGDENYGEAYINIDLRKKALEFRDKDLDYHRGILASLTSDT